MDFLINLFIGHLCAYGCVLFGFILGFSYKRTKRNIEEIIRRKDDFGKDYRFLRLSMFLIIAAATLESTTLQLGIIPILPRLINILGAILVSIGSSLLAIIVFNHFDLLKEILFHSSSKLFDEIPPYSKWKRRLKHNIVAITGTIPFALIANGDPFSIMERTLNTEKILTLAGFVYLIAISIWASKLYDKWLPPRKDTDDKE